MAGSLLAVLGLAFLDSINPSALAVTLYLLTQSHPSRVFPYLSGIFFTYSSLGILLMSGLGALLATLGGTLESPVAYALQGGVGAAMLLYSFMAPNKPKEQAAPLRTGPAGTFLLGVTVTFLEFPTAFPYLGAIGILTSAELGAAQWLLLLVYNLIFILPPTLLLVAYTVLGERLEARFANLRERLQRKTRETTLWIIGIVGFFLLVDSLRYFKFFGLKTDASAFSALLQVL